MPPEKKINNRPDEGQQKNRVNDAVTEAGAGAIRHILAGDAENGPVDGNGDDEDAEHDEELIHGGSDG